MQAFKVGKNLPLALQVERGPSVTAGSGALGGTVSATTKSASDFLKPGQTFGSEVKYGYNWNSHERLRMVTLYGRPNAHLDLIVSVARRDSDDFRLPDGELRYLSATARVVCDDTGRPARRYQ